MILRISIYFRLVLFGFIFLLIGCSRQTAKDGLLIAVSIPPQAWFVSQIAGDKAASLILVSPGQNPHTYEPAPRQLQRLTTARVWILSGLEFEISLLPRVETLFPNLLIVDGTQGVRFRLLEEPCHDCQLHGRPLIHHHSPFEIDRHTWLGRESAKILGRHIRDTLSQLDIENEAYYHMRYEDLSREIDNIFEELRITLAPLYDRSVFVYHPSFGYFLDEFGIRQEAVETGGNEPTPRQLSILLDKIIEERPAAIFVQTQFPVTAARTLANAVDAQLIELDPLAFDWLENIRRMGKSLQMALP
jgi:zinc transport system substrate-binding protein